MSAMKLGEGTMSGITARTTAITAMACALLLGAGCAETTQPESASVAQPSAEIERGWMMWTSPEFTVATFTDLFTWKPREAQTPADGAKAAVDSVRPRLTPDFELKSGGSFDYLGAAARDREAATNRLAKRWSDWRSAGAVIVATVSDAGTTDDYSQKTGPELAAAGLQWGKARARVRQYIRYPDGRLAPYRVFIASTDLVSLGTVTDGGPWRLVRYPTITDEAKLTPSIEGDLRAPTGS